MIAGATLESVIEDKLGQPVLIAVMLAVMGVVLYVVDRVARQDRGLDSIGPRTGLFVGTAQALALQPGVSRSGITITAGRLIGLDRATAARFSFLMALPIIAGAGRPQGARPGAIGVPGLRRAVPRGVHRRRRERVPRHLVPAPVPAEPRLPGLHGVPAGRGRARDRAGRRQRALRLRSRRRGRAPCPSSGPPRAGSLRARRGASPARSSRGRRSPSPRRRVAHLPVHLVQQLGAQATATTCRLDDEGLQLGEPVARRVRVVAVVERHQRVADGRSAPSSSASSRKLSGSASQVA